MHRSLYGMLFSVVVCCALSAVYAAPNSAVVDRDLNALARQNDRGIDSEDIDENPAAVAYLIARYGCMFAKSAAIVCNFLRNGEIGEMMLVERSDYEELDQIDMNEVRNVVKKYGCPVIKAVAVACKLIG